MEIAKLGGELCVTEESRTAMATIRFEGEAREIADQTRVFETCEELGMPFGCTEGICGTCRCTVVSGMENLRPLNDKEEDMDLGRDERLACQCVILGGTVEFSIG
jgi:ferredoxin